MADLVIKISGDVKDFEKALEDAQAKTESLNDGLGKLAVASGVAFAALTAEAFAAVSAFAESEAATNRLTAALQTQGIYSKELMEDYDGIAKAVSDMSGADDDAVVSSMALLQSMIGQTKITKDLAFAVQDLAVGRLGGDLNQAYALVGKAANGNTTALNKLGIQFEDSGDKAENLRRITEALNNTLGGQAAAAAQGLGGIQGLKTAFGNLQEQIGERLAPAVIFLVQKLTSFIKAVENNKPLLDLIVSFGVAAAGVAAVGLAVGTAGIAFLKLKAALEAARIATSAMAIATKGLVAATGLGLVLIVVTEIALNWNAIWPRMQGVFQAFVNNTLDLIKGWGKILLGAFTLSPSLFKEGLAEMKSALTKGLQDYNSVVDQKLAERQAIEDEAEKEKESKNNANAAREEALERQKAARLAAIEREKSNLKLLELNKGTEDQIRLQREEISILEALENEKSAAVIAAMRARLAQVQIEQQEAQRAATEQKLQEFEQEAILDQELEALSAEQRAALSQKKLDEIQKQVLTEKQVQEQAAAEQLQRQVKAHNEFLKNQQKFGTAYALINQLMHSAVFQGTAQAFGELAQLQQSSNNTLKSIGKVAAIANIVIRTAESAMNIYAGFSTIPIVGPALGVAGAAAAVAFGAEQISKVRAAAAGGVITGFGGPTSDRIPTMLSPGELVTPVKNFDETVNAVAAARMASGEAPGSGEGGGSSVGRVEVVLSLKDGLMDFVEANLVSRQALGLSIQGA